jgi:salicylate hydroxylase
MALEDGVTIAECLERAKTLEDIPTALQKYQGIRKPRCKLVQDWGASAAKIATLPDGKEQEERDRMYKAHNNHIQQKPWGGVHIDEIPEDGIKSKNWFAWLRGHDAIAFVSASQDHSFKTSKRIQS